MNVLFLTLARIDSLEGRGIYKDLLRKFKKEGHNITIVSPLQRKLKIKTNFKELDGINYLQVKTFNLTKTNILEKGIGTLCIEYQYLAAVKKFLKGKHFDLVLYSTPPITLVKVIEYIKQRDGAYTYLLLKDIFPQNAIDMQMMKPNSFLHKLFTKKEKQLYHISDKIGCMSPANVDFVLKHHPEIPSSKVEVNPNSIEPIEIHYSLEEKESIRTKYCLPLDRKILVYGGNLGKPQGLDFLIQTIKACQNPGAYFLIVGNGTEYVKIKQWFDIHNPTNAKLLNNLPKSDYDQLLGACDIGLIFLHKNFTIPNFPSRLLSYLEMGIPIISATDKNSDIGDVIKDNNCGFKVETGDLKGMLKSIDSMLFKDFMKYNFHTKKLLNNNFLVKHSYEIIINNVKK